MAYSFLLAVVSNLINNREKLRRDFAKSPFVAVNTMALTKADEEFIKKLNEIILSNLSNQEFSMDDMAESLNMSRSSFYRKMKGVLDLSPNEYLRIERLKRAAQLLKEGESRINEICYMVGFNSSSSPISELKKKKKKIKYKVFFNNLSPFSIIGRHASNVLCVNTHWDSSLILPFILR